MEVSQIHKKGADDDIDEVSSDESAKKNNE